MGTQKKKVTPLKICIVLEHFYPHIGGVETGFLRIAENLIKDGHYVVVATSDSGGRSGREVYRGVEIYHYHWKSFFGHPIPNKADIEEHVARSDIVHTTTYTAAPGSLVVAKKFNKPIVITTHEFLGNKWFWVDNFIRASVFALYEFWVLHKSYSHYLAVSKATMNDMVRFGIPKDKITVIYPMLEKLDSKKIKSIKPRLDAKYFLYYGRPGKTKGIFVLLKAIRLIKNILPKDFKFLFIISNDPLAERKRFIKKVDRWGLKNIVEIMPSQDWDALLGYVLGAYAVIIPSITEGFGLTTVESCQLGKKVIVSDGGSLPEVSFGRVLSFRNRDHRDLARKLILACNDKFTKKSNTLMDNDAILDNLEGVYAKLVAR